MADDLKKSKDIQRLGKLVRFQPIRFVHIFFSIILTLYGTGILLATLTVKTELCDYLPFLHYYLDKPVIVLLVVSIALTCLGCLGIISSGQNLYQGIVTFGVLLFGLFMFELTMGVVFLAISNSADRSILQALKTHVDNYTAYNDSMDFVQTNLNCCGIYNFYDWNSTLGYIPGSCCNSDSACGNSLINDILNLNETGCYAALRELINYFIYYLIMILLLLAAFQVTTMFITFYLARGIADYRRRKSRSCSEENRQVQNPLGSKSNRINPLAENTSDQEVPEPGIGVRQSVVQNPIYKDHSFTSNNDLRLKVTPTPPKLPQAHRRYPLGILRQGYKR